jgi:lysozyme family protein
MKSNFQRALAAVLKHEGGYVNHPKDPGGATNKGVTQAVYDASRKRWGYGVRSVKFITDAEVSTIYRTQYWDAVAGDDLPDGLDYAVFDYAVNSGPHRAIQHLQIALGVSSDGRIGFVTLNAVKLRNVKRTIEDLCELRMRFLKRLNTWPTFGKGWSRRVEGVKATALKWASEARTEAPEVPATTLPPTPEKPVTEVQKPVLGLWGAILAFIRKLFGK